MQNQVVNVAPLHLATRGTRMLAYTVCLEDHNHIHDIGSYPDGAPNISRQISGQMDDCS